MMNVLRMAGALFILHSHHFTADWSSGRIDYIQGIEPFARIVPAQFNFAAQLDTRTEQKQFPRPAKRGEISPKQISRFEPLNLVGTARCAVRAAFSGAIVPPAASRAGTSQRDVPTNVRFMERAGVMGSCL
jgi:hypothetical protein